MGMDKNDLKNWKRIEQDIQKMTKHISKLEKFKTQIR